YINAIINNNTSPITGHAAIRKRQSHDISRTVKGYHYFEMAQYKGFFKFGPLSLNIINFTMDV
ncbi:MAG: hypothetical protein PHQ71_00430, partial [Candidatus Hydrothermia bacterium]|nr:hypothetical protein [Candidatus Hydrothermia bacterium]